jgi:hypothetical protein
MTMHRALIRSLQPNAPIQSAMARPISSGESSRTVWLVTAGMMVWGTGSIVWRRAVRRQRLPNRFGS